MTAIPKTLVSADRQEPPTLPVSQQAFYALTYSGNRIAEGKERLQLKLSPLEPSLIPSRLNENIQTCNSFSAFVAGDSRGSSFVPKCLFSLHDWSGPITSTHERELRLFCGLFPWALWPHIVMDIAGTSLKVTSPPSAWQDPQTFS